MKKFIAIYFIYLHVFNHPVLVAQNCGFIHQKNDNIEYFTEGYVRQFSERLQTRRVVQIPIVVHIVYNSDIENISLAQIQSQIDVLNRDFRKRNADTSDTPFNFKSRAVDCEFEFHLATRDTNGAPTTGIVRESTSVMNIGSQFFDISQRKIYYSDFGGDNAWKPSHYLNIWVCAINGDLMTGTNGFATPLAQALQTPAEDGCVVDYRAFGTVGTLRPFRQKGRTLVHEIGHYFNLLHIFGSDATCNDDDEVADTPLQAGQSIGCPAFPTPQSCAGNGGDMFMNYMDYSYDGCLNMFTLGQKARMWASLMGFRQGLLGGGVKTNNVYNPEWRISPNPTDGNLQIEVDNKSAQSSKLIKILNIYGNVIWQKTFETETINADIRTFINGVYFMTLTVDNHVFMKKIVLNK